MDKFKIMVVAGEASADLHASSLIKAFKSTVPLLEVYGIGGKHLKEQGANLWFDFSKTGVVGIFEVIPKIKEFFTARKIFLKKIPQIKPNFILLLDLPDFNLSLAKKIKKLYPEQKIIYFISPQIWAWRKKRVKKIKKYIDLMLLILPFELKFYKEANIRAEFVGHPLKERVIASTNREMIRQRLGIKPNEIAVALMPGSRKEELKIYLPRIIKAVKRLSSKNKELSFFLKLAPTVSQDLVRSYFQKYGFSCDIISEEGYDLLFGADLAIVASGTATLESALATLPMLILARTSWLNYIIARPFVDVPFFGLPNLIAGKEIVRELVQGEVNPERIEKEFNKLLDPEIQKNIKKELNEMSRKLGETNAIKKAMDKILEFLNENGSGS